MSGLTLDRGNYMRKTNNSYKMIDAFCAGALSLRMNHIGIGGFHSSPGEDRMVQTWKGVEKSFNQAGSSISEAVRDALRS